MLRDIKKEKSHSRNDVINLLIGKDFLVKVPVTSSYEKIFKMEAHDYKLAIKGIATLISYLKNPKNKKDNKSISDLIKFLDNQIEIDQLQLAANITLGGQVQERLEKNQQLRTLFQDFLSTGSLKNVKVNDALSNHDILKNHIEYLANLSDESEEKIDLIISLETLKEKHINQRKELKTIANYLSKGSEFDTIIRPLFVTIEKIKKSKGSAEKEGKKKAEKRFEKEEEEKFEEFVQFKIENEIKVIAEKNLTKKIKNETSTRIKNEEKAKIEKEKKAVHKKYWFLTLDDRETITQEEINKEIRAQINSLIGPKETNAIKKVIKLDLLNKASTLQANASKRHPMLDIYGTLSRSFEPKKISRHSTKLDYNLFKPTTNTHKISNDRKIEKKFTQKTR